MVVLLAKLKYDSVFDQLLPDTAIYCKGHINSICMKHGCVNMGEFMLVNILGWQRKLPILFKSQF